MKREEPEDIRGVSVAWQATPVIRIAPTPPA
jgi:hypothetical protein